MRAKVVKNMGQLAEHPLFLIYFAKTVRLTPMGTHANNLCPHPESAQQSATQNNA